MSVIDLGNTFEINPKWARTLPSGIFDEICKKPLLPPAQFVFIEIDI
jgi:hypothetical protein